jgi:dipeptidyl aminopeptidase/acylaminoacyl peptidase
VERWVFDHAGELRCALRLGGLRNELLCKRAATGTFRRVLVLDAVRDLFIPAVFTADNRLLVAYSNIGRERVAVVTVDPETGEETGVLFEHPDYDVFGDDESDHIRFSAYRREISFAFYTTQRRTYRFFDSVSRRIIDALGERFPGHVIRLPSSSADERFFLVKVSGDRLAGEYYLYDVEKDTTTFLESDCPWLQERELAPKQPISFRARDGATVHGYLVLPVGLPARNLPLVVYPHGGPHWRDVWEMGRFREVQLLANRGFGVLLVNFRGSTGYGKTFLTEGFKENGLKVQDDITDGVNYVVSRGIADPARIAIIGGSYGGYAVLAGLAFTPELYACGVDLFGVSSFFTFLDALSRFTDMSVMYERVGHPERDRKLLKRTSPLFHVDSIRVPLLVAQGGRDPVVPRAESDQIVTALRRRGVPVTYIFHEDEGHGYFAQEDHWLELWRTIEVFLAEHLGEGSP